MGSHSSSFGQEKVVLPLPGIGPRFLCCSAGNVVTVLTEISLDRQKLFIILQL